MQSIEKQRSFSARGVGEVVLRVRDLDAMIAFYRDVLGLELLKRFDQGIAFMRVAEGFGGHTQIIGFFARELASNFKRRVWPGCDPDLTTLHHFALELSLEEYEPALEYFKSLGVQTDTAIHSWIGWRSIYVRDLEQNTVELVCFDASVLER